MCTQYTHVAQAKFSPFSHPVLYKSYLLCVNLYIPMGNLKPSDFRKHSVSFVCYVCGGGSSTNMW